MLGATMPNDMNKSMASSFKNIHYNEKVKVIASVRQHCQQAENTVLAEFGTAVTLHQYITVKIHTSKSKSST